MKLDGATIPIERRSIGGCLDLAFSLYRSHLAKLSILTAIFALPTLALTFWMASVTELGLAFSVTLFVLISPYLALLLVAATGHRVFGEKLSIASAFRNARIGWRSPRFVLNPSRIVLAGIVFLALAQERREAAVLILQLTLLPLHFLLRIAFLPEVLVLERLTGSRAGLRLRELRRTHYLTLAIRSQVLMFFGFLVAISLFTVLEHGSRLLLGTSLISGETTSDLALSVEEILDRLRYHPVLLCALQATLWISYPLARIAWFFCYLDRRIRREGWDAELDFRVEARRLEEFLS